MATEDWIQESLARLESLEEERNRHEAALETANDSATLRMHTQAIERLEAKIRSLYAELEAAAEQGDGSAEADSDDDDSDDSDDQAEPAVNVETRLFKREDVAAQAAAVLTSAPAQPAPVSTPMASPFGGSAPASTPAPASPFGGSAPAPASPFGGSAPAPAPASPFGGSAPEASPFGGSVPASNMFGSSSGASFSSAPASSFSGSGASLEDDDSGRRSGAPWGLVIGLVVVLGGVGGYFALRPKDEPPPVVPTGPATVIKAIEVPPDTQGPKVVKGSNVDSISGTQYKEGRSQPSGGGGGGSSAPAGDKPKKKDPRTKIESTDDPLAGIDK